MRVITIRNRADRSLVCFGQEDGQYNPAYAETTQVRATEPDYDAVLAEWQARPGPTTADKDAALQAFLDSAGGKVVKALATVLIQKGVCTLMEIKTAYRAL